MQRSCPVQAVGWWSEVAAMAMLLLGPLFHLLQLQLLAWAVVVGAPLASAAAAAAAERPGSQAFVCACPWCCSALAAAQHGIAATAAAGVLAAARHPAPSWHGSALFGAAFAACHAAGPLQGVAHPASWSAQFAAACR